MNGRGFAYAAIAALLTTVLFGATSALAAPRVDVSPVSAIPVSGTFTDSAGAGIFAGTLEIQRFDGRRGALVAVGRISGTLTDALGGTRAITDQAVTLPVSNVSVGGTSALQSSDTDASVGIQQVAQDCQILHLEFGGITLNVLGVQLQLSPIVLDLSLGGLLGGILCGLLGALAGGAPAPAQANMLNQALGLNP